MKTTTSAYQRDLQALLASYDEEVTRRLREFIALPIERDVVHVSFEDCLDTHGQKFPVLIAVTNASNGVYCDARRCALSTISFALPPSLNPAASDCGVNDASEEWKAAFYPWFQLRWIAAGGLSYPVPASIGELDGPDSFDLATGKWSASR